MEKNKPSSGRTSFRSSINSGSSSRSSSSSSRGSRPSFSRSSSSSTGSRPSAGGFRAGSSRPSSSFSPSSAPRTSSSRSVFSPSSGSRVSAPRSGGSSTSSSSSYRGGSASGGSSSRFGGYGGSRGPSRGPSRGGFGGGARRGFGGGGGRRGFKSSRIDISKYINKAVITEEVEKFVPDHSFADFAIADSLKQNVIKKGYVNPTPIQDKTIPHILRGADVVGIANTGTGKTAAFLIPLISKVINNPKENVLVVVPTRELAIQIEQELQGFTPGMKIFSVCCVGGAFIGRQISELRFQNNFIIGTPGRLKDLIERKKINLNEFKSVVLDEADRMLDMGFINDMKYMMALMPKDRQTLFFSATMSPDIERLIKDFLKDPVKISVKTQDTSKNVDQNVVRVEKGSDKITVLHDLLTKPEFDKVLIFGKTKHGVEQLANLLVRKGIKAESIHGNKNHSQRQRSLNAFKNNQVQVLVATDVAARGLDISGISHVINYDVPATYDDYVHRIGRTGRGDTKGKALTFID